MMETLVSRLREISAEHLSELPEGFRWTDETDRWYELVYCIFAQLSGLEQARLRRIVGALDTLDLLPVNKIGLLPVRDGKIDTSDPHWALLVEVLTANGIEKEKAVLCLYLVAEAARGIADNYAGKLQRLIRLQVPSIVAAVMRTIQLSGVPMPERQRILTLWLQNAFELPVGMSNPYVEQFCRENGADIKDLEDAADALDINLAVVDDLIQLHMAGREVKTAGMA